MRESDKTARAIVGQYRGDVEPHFQSYCQFVHLLQRDIAASNRVAQKNMRDRCAAIAKSFIEPPPIPGAIDTRTIHGNERAQRIHDAIGALEVE